MGDLPASIFDRKLDTVHSGDTISPTAGFVVSSLVSFQQQPQFRVSPLNENKQRPVQQFAGFGGQFVSINWLWQQSHLILLSIAIRLPNGELSSQLSHLRTARGWILCHAR